MVSPASSAVTRARLRGLQITSRSPEPRRRSGKRGQFRPVRARVRSGRGQLLLVVFAIPGPFHLPVPKKNQSMVDDAHRRPILPDAVAACQDGPRDPKVLADASQGRGGETTRRRVALGAAFVDEESRVLLADLDPQGCLTFSRSLESRDKLPKCRSTKCCWGGQPSAALVTIGGA